VKRGIVDYFPNERNEDLPDSYPTVPDVTSLQLTLVERLAIAATASPSSECSPRVGRGESVCSRSTREMRSATRGNGNPARQQAAVKYFLVSSARMEAARFSRSSLAPSFLAMEGRPRP